MPGIETVEAAVVAQLEKISAENGYRSDVKRVYRVPLNADQMPEGNNLVVVPMPDAMSHEPGGNGAYLMHDILVVGGTVALGVADLMDPERCTRVNHLMEDAIDCLLEDPALGMKPHLDTTLEIGDRGVDADRGFGYFTLRLKLTYPFARRTM